MAQSQFEEPSPTIKRLMAVAWVAIVLTISACIFLATWWAYNRPEEPEPEIALPEVEPSLEVNVSTPTPLSAPTGAPGMPVVTPTALTPMPTATPLPVADESFGYGIEVNAMDNTVQTMEQSQRLGMGWIRQTVHWAEIEPQPGIYNWEELDPVLVEAAAHSLKVLVTVTQAPDWARSVTAEGFEGPPDDPALYAGFVTQLIHRYRGAIHGIEVWQEMNQDRNWYTAGGLGSAGYMTLLRTTTDAIHQADPGIIVISGGLNPTGVDDGVIAIDDFRYMQDMINAGLLDIVDCVGVRHKGYNLPPDVPYDSREYRDETALFQQPFENRHHSWSFYSTLRGYHDMIVAAGRSTPMCVTEFGWPTIGQLRREGAPDFVYDNTPQEQAAYIVQAYELMWEWDFVWLAFLSNLDLLTNEVALSANDLTIYYRIVTPDGLPRPAYDALIALDKRP